MTPNQLYTVCVRFHHDFCLIIPVRIGAGEDVPDHAPWTQMRGPLTLAQSEVLCRHAMAFRDVAEQVRDLARGRFDAADLDDDCVAGHDPPRDDRRAGGNARDVRCYGGRVYWW